MRKPRKTFFGFRYADIVSARKGFMGRITPPPTLNGNTADPWTTEIPAQTVGIVHGFATGAPDLLDVEFDLGDHGYLRVEAFPEDIEAHRQ